MVNYRVRCESDYKIVRERDDEDEWDAGEDGYFNHQFLVYKEGDLGFHQANDFSFESGLPDPKILVVIYGDGCTFGYTGGYVAYYGPFTANEATELALLIEDGKIKEYRKRYIAITGGSYASTPWTGYFANLEKVEIIRTYF